MWNFLILFPTLNKRKGMNWQSWLVKRFAIECCFSFLINNLLTELKGIVFPWQKVFLLSRAVAPGNSVQNPNFYNVSWNIFSIYQKFKNIIRSHIFRIRIPTNFIHFWTKTNWDVYQKVAILDMRTAFYTKINLHYF